MGWLFFYLSLAIGVSFLCSILEAVILSVSPAYVEALGQRDPKAGGTLRRMKEDIDRPLAAILSLNTVAHTVGAAGVGAQSLVLFGDGFVALTSAILTLLILFLSEIIPKTLGAYYWQRLAHFTVVVLPPLIWLLYPLVFLSQKLAGLLASEEHMSNISREEIRAMADLARKEGVVSEQESRIMKNMLLVRQLKMRDIMTPRPVVFSLPAEMRVSQAIEAHPDMIFSRIPLYQEDQEDIHSVVLKDDILAASRDQGDTSLLSLAKPIQVVPETASFYQVFETLLGQRTHIALVVDEYGGLAGVVTIEDVIETLLGIEIVDESDKETDMQAAARAQWERRARASGMDIASTEQSRDEGADAEGTERR
jgi:magnesium and cobalt exporter, CNNM family